MRLVALLAVIAVLLPASTSPLSANSPINYVKTPDIIPGSSGTIELYIQNPFSLEMRNITLQLHIYAFIQKGRITYLQSIKPQARPVFSNGLDTIWVNITSLLPSQSAYLNVTVRTHAYTMHGSFFSPGSYGVSSILSFIRGGHVLRYASPGVFNSSTWARILYMQNGTEHLNYTLLESLGYSGLVPDSSFGVDSPSPLYLIYISVLLSAAFAAIAYISYRRSK